ncbi:hypothetical protein KCV01_g9060, partial [Aureobasidium melanogenum]
MTSDRPSADAGPTRFLPRPLRVLAGRAMESVLNRAVDLDPDTRQRLDALDGRSVQIHLSGPELALRVTVEKGRLRVGPAEDGGSLRVTASPGSLLAMAAHCDAAGIAFCPNPRTPEQRDHWLARAPRWLLAGEDRGLLLAALRARRRELESTQGAPAS